MDPKSFCEKKNGFQTQALDNTCFPSLDTVFMAGTEKKLTEQSPHLIIFQGRDQSIFLNLEHFCIGLLFCTSWPNIFMILAVTGSVGNLIGHKVCRASG